MSNKERQLKIPLFSPFVESNNNLEDNIDVKSEFFLFTDGASRGNPGRSGIGIFLKDRDSIILKRSFYIGGKTNNQAEYLALACAL